MAAKKEFSEDRYYVMLNRYNAAYEVGFGMDFYLPYFKLGVEFKMSQFFLNAKNNLPDEDYPHLVETIDKIYPSIYMISFHFE